MRKGDGLGGGEEVAPAPTMISQDAPILEACEDMLDSSTPLAVPPPCGISYDPSVSNYRKDELFDAAVATVGEHAAV